MHVKENVIGSFARIQLQYKAVDAFSTSLITPHQGLLRKRNVFASGFSCKIPPNN